VADESNNNDVFSGQPTEETSAVDALVGDGKKFKTIDDLAKGKQEADSFIEQLKAKQEEMANELENLKAQQAASTTAGDVLKALKESNQSTEKPVLDEDDLVQKVRQILQGETAEQTAKRNREQANNLLLEKAGSQEAAREYLAGRARELGVSVDKLRELGETSPTLFAKAVDVDLRAKEASASQLPGVNADALAAGGSQLEVDGVPTKAYFDKLRKDMGNYAFIQDSGIQTRMVRAAEKLGSKFYS
jgi:hypothetical protein